MVIRMLSFVARVEFNWISALCTCCIEIVPVQRLSTYVFSESYGGLGKTVITWTLQIADNLV